MNTKPVFHGSDIEKICEYYHLKKEDIINFGANATRSGCQLLSKPRLPHIWIYSLPILTENTLLSGRYSQLTAVSRQTTSSRGTVPAS